MPRYLRRKSTRRVALATLSAVLVVAILVVRGFSDHETGRFSYARAEAAWLVFGDTGHAYLQPQTRELWKSSDGSGRLHVVFGDADFLGSRAESRWANRYERPPDSRSAAGMLSFD